MYKLTRVFQKVFKLNKSKGFTDYPNWIRDESIANILMDLLGSKDSEYKRLTKEDLAEKYLKPHLNNHLLNYSDKILRAATLEIYLRQVFRGM